MPGRDGLRWDAIRRQLGSSSALAEMVVRSLDTTDSLSVQEHLSRDRTTRVREVDQATYAVAPKQPIESCQRMKLRNARRADIAGLFLCRWVARAPALPLERELGGASWKAPDDTDKALRPLKEERKRPSKKKALSLFVVSAQSAQSV